MAVSLLVFKQEPVNPAMDTVQMEASRRERSSSECSSLSTTSDATVSKPDEVSDFSAGERKRGKLNKSRKFITDSPQTMSSSELPRRYANRKPRISTVSAPARNDFAMDQSEAEENLCRRISYDGPNMQNCQLAVQPMYLTMHGVSSSEVPFTLVPMAINHAGFYRMQSNSDSVDGGLRSREDSVTSSDSRIRSKSPQPLVGTQQESDAMVLKLMSPSDPPATLTAGQSVIPGGRRNSPEGFDSVSLDPSNSTSNIFTVSTTVPSISSLISKQEDERNFQSLVSVKSIRQPESSASRTPAPTSMKEKQETLKKYLTIMLSCIYGTFIVMLGLVIYVADNFNADERIAETFNLYLTVVGLLWLIFLHFDIRRYVNRTQRKKRKAKQLGIVELGSESAGDYLKHQNSLSVDACTSPVGYCFRTGRHSGSFYLKIGAAGFCFGHLIHEGLLLSRQIIYYTHEVEYYKTHCLRVFTLVLDVIHPLLSFYQLFIIFKYSNVVINRYKEVARFALMHIIASNICLWLRTILRETLESLQQKLHFGNNSAIIQYNHSALDEISKILKGTEKHNTCVSKEVLSEFTIDASPYLYPFTIEYSLLVVGVWFIIWHNIGKTDCQQEQDDLTDGNYTSNLVIHVDCHSANRGLFAGLFVLLSTVISVIIFFVAVMNEEYVDTGVLINNVSDLALLVIMTLSIMVAYRQTSKLDFNAHAVTFLDDILLFVALPCFFLYGLFNVAVGMQVHNIFSIVSGVLSILQVTLQTPFIIDGLRRCSNSHGLRYQKPGRELITFLVVCNLAMWILETFEIKNAGAHLDQIAVFGKFAWTFLSHITLPLTLFYRFHSSVCLVDIWKSAYEIGD